MMEMEQEEYFEGSDLYDSGDIMERESGGLPFEGEFSELTRDNYVDRVRFDRIPSETRVAGKGEETAASADPLYIYYRSMSKIRLLTREEEVYLAKKIETAKMNVLRLLSLTPINSRKVIEIADELHPVSATANVAPQIGFGEAPRDAESEIPLEERNRLRDIRVRKIVARLEKHEIKYREFKADMAQSKNGNRAKLLVRIKFCRDNVLKTLQCFDLNENRWRTSPAASRTFFSRWTVPTR
jgi:hypothetical protein